MINHLIASCVRNIRTKNYQNLTIAFQVTVENVGDVFFETRCNDCVRYLVHVVKNELAGC